MTRLRSFIPFALAAAMVSCAGETPQPAPVPPPQPAASVATTAAPSPTPSASTSAASSATPSPAEQNAASAPSPIAKYSGFSLPESVVYDEAADRYLVSNINGRPLDKDNNGFISALSPDGQVTALKWIEAGKTNVKLDAPKGMGIAKGVLYVADISVVRMFDLKSGAPKGETAVAGATFLNDIAVGPDGKVYVSDSGMKANAKGDFESSGTDAVYVIEKGHATAIAKGAQLGGPNGIAWTNKGLVVCTFGSNEVYRLDEKGAKQDVTKTPGGHLDGLLVLGDSLLVTSHDASAILRGKLGGTFEVALPSQKSPADIGYDTKRGRVLVPHLMDGTVETYALK